MPARELKERLLRCHPILTEYLGKGIGLEFQYLDSQITEKILLASLETGLVALPIHDSYICQRHRVSELISVMHLAHTKVMGEPPILKPVEPYRSDYQLVVDAEGRPDLEALYRMHSQSIHNRFVESWCSLPLN